MPMRASVIGWPVAVRLSIWARKVTPSPMRTRSCRSWVETATAARGDDCGCAAR